MTERPENPLEALAVACGVTLAYRDGMGTERTVGRDTLKAMLNALGQPAESDREAQDRLAALRKEQAERFCPPTLVVRGERPLDVALTVAEGGGSDGIAWRLETDDGAVFTGTAGWQDLPLLEADDVDGRRVERRGLRISAPFAAGYHRLAVERTGGGRSSRCAAHVISAPPACYVPERMPRRWGVGVQLYGLRSERNWGLGDYTDAAATAERAAGQGADFLGLNPVHALFPADRNHFGPYAPSSRRFFNTAYLDPAAVPGFAECEEARRIVAENRKAIDAARAAELVDYPAVDAAKRPVLEALWRRFRKTELADGGEAAARFAAYRAREGRALDTHAIFNALHEHFFSQDPGKWFWRTWPAEYREPNSDAVARFAEEHAERLDFFAWLQWLADEQMAAAQRRARGAGMAIGLYADMAVAVAHGGSAAWAHHHLVPTDISVGAPPDDFNPLGQNWGLAPFSPLRLVERGFDVFAADVGATMRHAGAMRIDHAMKLQRLFWIPPGGSGRDGAYVRYPRDEMLAVIALESHRNRCIVIGEDLGTVPEGFREALARENVLTYKIFYFERGADGRFTPPENYAEQALAAPTTHDLPTLKGMLARRDLEWRDRLELYPDDETRKASHEEREQALVQLRKTLVQAGFLDRENAPDEDVIVAVHAYLAQAPSRLMVVQAEDLAGSIEQPNLPGTSEEHPNWRRKLPEDIDALFDGGLARRIIAAVRSGRGGP